MTFEKLLSARSTRTVALIVGVGFCLAFGVYQAQTSRTSSVTLSGNQAMSQAIDHAAQGAPMFLPSTVRFDGGKVRAMGLDTHLYH